MKTCPECKSLFQRRTKDCCPHCRTPLLISKGVVRRLSDKLIVDEILLKLKTHIEERDQITLPFTYSEYSRERLFAYNLVDRTRTFLAAQQDKISISPREFLLGLLDYVLSHPWWSKNLHSLIQLYNKVSELAKDYFKTLRKQFVIQNAEVYRLSLQQPTGVQIQYGI